VGLPNKTHWVFWGICLGFSILLQTYCLPMLMYLAVQQFVSVTVCTKKLSQ